MAISPSAHMIKENGKAAQRIRNHDGRPGHLDGLGRAENRPTPMAAPSAIRLICLSSRPRCRFCCESCTGVSSCNGGVRRDKPGAVFVAADTLDQAARRAWVRPAGVFRVGLPTEAAEYKNCPWVSPCFSQKSQEFSVFTASGGDSTRAWCGRGGNGAERRAYQLVTPACKARTVCRAGLSG